MGISYQEVYLKPRYSPHFSRSEIDVSVQFGPQKFKLPAVPANMKCCIDTKLAKWMSENGYFYIMHRFGTKDISFTPEACREDTYWFVREANGMLYGGGEQKRWKTISISVGVNEADADMLRKIASEGLEIDYITIDIAHAHSIGMQKMIAAINRIYARRTHKPFIIAGNVATADAVMELESWGADAVKVGIAQGNACTTYGQTGFGVPMFSCMTECSEVATKPLIADGGIRGNGDFAKALVAGGDMVMAGGFFASSVDSPAELVTKTFLSNEVSVDRGRGMNVSYNPIYTEKKFKRYYGSASFYNKHNKKHVEGRLVELECDETTYAEKLTYLEEHLQSSVSYAGGNLATVEYGILD